MTDTPRTQSFDIAVTILAPDGYHSWLADVEIVGTGAKWHGVYLQGATEDEAIRSVVKLFRVRDADGREIALSVEGVRDDPDKDTPA